jgi:cytochrome c oxidase subunit 2
VLALLALVLAGCSGEQTMLDPQGPFARDPDNLFKGVLIVAAIVFVFVQGLIIFTSWRFRRGEDDNEVPEQVHGNTMLEIVWTVIPLLILIGIAVPTVQQVLSLAEEPDGALTVEVIGHRWWWEYRYPDSGVITANELVIPVDTPIRLEMRAEESGSADRGVLHSFWVPALAGKQDVIPGRVSTLNMLAEEPGRYLGQCAEYCGLSHANMRNRAVALEQEDFDAWVAAQQQPSQVAAAFADLSPQDIEAEVVPDGVPEDVGRGYYVYNQSNCIACHGQMSTTPVASADDFENRQGPNLTHLMSRKEFAGAIFDLYERVDPDDPNSEFTDQVDREMLTAWVRNAPSLKAMTPEDGVGMPSFEQGATVNTTGAIQGGLAPEDLDDLIAYLLTME